MFYSQPKTNISGKPKKWYPHTGCEKQDQAKFEELLGHDF